MKARATKTIMQPNPPSLILRSLSDTDLGMGGHFFVVDKFGFFKFHFGSILRGGETPVIKAVFQPVFFKV